MTSKNRNFIKISRGVDIKLKGEADKIRQEAKRSKVYALKPSGFLGIVPKLAVKEGQEVLAGEELFFSKSNPSIKFASPISGVVRGEKRKILSIQVTANPEDEYVEHNKQDVASLSREGLKELLLKSGCWAFIKQRPYDVIASLEDTPKAILLSML